MIFYLCQTANGPQLAGTQADAKALDRNFEQVDLPTDKAGYMAYVNDLLAKQLRGPPPVITVPDDLDIPEEIAKAPRKLEVKKDRLWDQIGIEEHIFALGPKDTGMLDAIERTVAARRSEIEKGIAI